MQTKLLQTEAKRGSSLQTGLRRLARRVRDENSAEFYVVRFGGKSRVKRMSGYVILYALLISSVLLAISLGIANIAFKELAFSSTAKQSNVGFFAADTGMECALYADRTVGSIDPTGAAIANISCNGLTATANPSLVGGGALYQFTGIPTAGNNTCALINVYKNVQINTTGTPIIGTKIEVTG